MSQMVMEVSTVYYNVVMLTLTSSPTQYFPAVCFRIGSRAGIEQNVHVSNAINLFIYIFYLNLLTLKTTINEVLSPLHLLCSYFLQHVQILKYSGINTMNYLCYVTTLHFIMSCLNSK